MKPSRRTITTLSRFITCIRNWPVRSVALALIWGSLLFFSCKDDATLVGFKKDPRLATRYVEIPLTQSIFLREPIRTQNIAENEVSRLLVGRANDPALGNIEASAYFNFSPPIETAFPTGAAVFESLELQLKFDYYSFGTMDSSDLQLQVFDILDPLTPDQEYYGSSPVSIGAVPVGDTTIALGPAELKEGWNRFVDNDGTNNVFFTLKIKLSGATGQSLLNDLINDRLVFDDFGAFSSRYPGFAVKMPAGNKILGFTPVYTLPTPVTEDSKIILKYKEGTNTIAVDFPIYYTSISGQLIPVVSFSHLYSDLTGTPLDGILPFQDFTPADNQLYIQSGLGVLTKFELDNVYTYFDTLENVVINSAEMVFDNTSDLRSPQKLQMLLLDSLNGFRGIYLDTVINGTLIRINDPYLIRIQKGIIPLTISETESRVSLLNDLTGGSVSVNQQTGKIGLTIFTEFFQQIVNYKTHKRRARAFAVYPEQGEFEKTVSTLTLNPSSATLKIYYSKPLTSLP